MYLLCFVHSCCCCTICFCLFAGFEIFEQGPSVWLPRVSVTVTQIYSVSPLPLCVTTTLATHSLQDPPPRCVEYRPNPIKFSPALTQIVLRTTPPLCETVRGSIWTYTHLCGFPLIHMRCAIFTFVFDVFMSLVCPVALACGASPTSDKNTPLKFWSMHLGVCLAKHL